MPNDEPEPQNESERMLIEGFHFLEFSRAMGDGVGFIPLTEIICYHEAADMDCDGISRSFFMLAIRSLDQIWIADFHKKQKLKQDGQSPVPSE